MKKCYLINGILSWILAVDGKEIAFAGGFNARYFAGIYHELGYEVEYLKEFGQYDRASIEPGDQVLIKPRGDVPAYRIDETHALGTVSEPLQEPGIGSRKYAGQVAIVQLPGYDRTINIKIEDLYLVCSTGRTFGRYVGIA